mgnify:CR=1 FL=1
MSFDCIKIALVDILASSIGSLTNPTKLANTFTSNNIKTSEIAKEQLSNKGIDVFTKEKFAGLDSYETNLTVDCIGKTLLRLESWSITDFA